MKIFTDKTLVDEIKVLDLGIVTAGETKEFTFFVQNELDAFIQDLKFNTENPEVKIIEAPLMMESKAIKPLVLSWTPSVTLRQGLKTQLSIVGTELWG